MRDFDTAIRLDPMNPMLYSLRSGTYREIGQHERAILDYDMAILLNPQNLITYQSLEQCYDDLGDSDEAQANFRRTAELDSTEG